MATVLVGACAAAAAPSVAALLPQASPSAEGLPTSPLASVLPSPSASPDPEQVRKAAGTQYLAAAKVSNTASKKLDAKYGQTFTLKQARAYFTAAAKIEGTFLAAIRAIVVPADTATDMHTLIVRTTASQALYVELSKARTLRDVITADYDLRRVARNSSAAANLIRSDLGLAPVPF
jgi:hypothetical protein